MKKIIGYVHLWLGLMSGLVVFIVASTGAVLTFEDELERFIISPDLYYVKSSGDQLPIDSLMNIATPELLKLKNGSKASRVFLNKNPERSIIIGFNYNDENDDNHRGHVFINPYTGKILGAREGNPHHWIWSEITELHINLLLGEFGGILVTWGTLVFLVMVISGIVLWWPKNKSALSQRYKFKWKESTKWKRKNYDLHNILGFYACWVVVFMIVTGLMWSFEWFNQGVYYITSGGETMKTSYSESIRAEEDSLDKKIYPVVPSQYITAKEAFIKKYPEIYANADGIEIGYFANEKDKTFDVSATYDPEGVRGSKNIWAFYDKSTNKITRDNFEDIRNFADAIQQSTNELHYGSFFGLTSKIATFFACIIAASLPITGFYIWWGRKKKIRKASLILT